MISFVCGIAGGGKSMYATSLLIAECLKGDRCIVTNLAITLPGLSVYLGERGCHIDVSERVKLLDQDDVKRFFEHRSFREDAWQKIEIRDKGTIWGDASHAGILYIIDEAHLFFDSRQWQQTGPDLTYYLTQHRKFTDDVVFVTQFLDQVEKRLKGNCGEFNFLRNHGNDRLFGFRLPSVFQRRSYYKPPGPGTPCSELAVFRLDAAGLGSCYRTGGGVGITGLADVGKARRGIPWKWAVVAGVVCLGLLALFPKVLASSVVGFLDPKKGGAKNPSMASMAAPSNQVVSASVAAKPLVADVPIVKPVPLPEVFCTGFSSMGGVRRVYVSDGRTVDGDQISRMYVDRIILKDGSVLPYAQNVGVPVWGGSVHASEIPKRLVRSGVF